MTHLTKAERIVRRERKQQTDTDYKGNRSPQPYRRSREEVAQYIAELNTDWRTGNDSGNK